jgi:hypothetical protein
MHSGCNSEKAGAVNPSPAVSVNINPGTWMARDSQVYKVQMGDNKLFKVI